MSRSDVKPLSYMELESFLANVEKDKVAAVERPLGAAPEPEPAPAPPEYCPHCNSRLSPLDLKFGLCMSCNKALGFGRRREDEVARRPVSVGI